MWVLTASTLRWSSAPISWFVAGVANEPPSLYGRQRATRTLRWARRDRRRRGGLARDRSRLREWRRPVAGRPRWCGRSGARRRRAAAGARAPAPRSRRSRCGRARRRPGCTRRARPRSGRAGPRPPRPSRAARRPSRPAPPRARLLPPRSRDDPLLVSPVAEDQERPAGPFGLDLRLQLRRARRPSFAHGRILGAKPEPARRRGQLAAMDRVHGRMSICIRRRRPPHSLDGHRHPGILLRLVPRLRGLLHGSACCCVFLRLMRSTVGSTKPETVKASKTEPVLWEEVQGVDAAKDELIDVAEWLREPERFAALGARAAARGAALRPARNRQDDAGARRRRPGRGRLLRRLRLQLRRDVRRPRRRADPPPLQGGAQVRARGDLHRRARRGRRRPQRRRRRRLQRARAGPEPAAGRARRLRERPGDGDRDRRLQLRRQARQGAAAPGPLRPPGAGRAARPRRPRGDPPQPRQGQAAGRRPRPHRRRPQDDRDDRRPARQRAQRGGDHRRPRRARGDGARGPRRGAAAAVGRLPAGAPPEPEGAPHRRLPRGRPRALPQAARARPAGDPQHRPARPGARLRRPLARRRTAT